MRIKLRLALALALRKLGRERIGSSRGGYTGLVVAGAVPDFTGRPCPPGQAESCLDLACAAPIHDPRARAFVIADPFFAFGTADTLKGVAAPIQLWSSATGGDGVAPEQVALVARQLPRRPGFHAMPNSAHFAFLAPCPPRLVETAPQFCEDGPGFDRASFHGMTSTFSLLATASAATAAARLTRAALRSPGRTTARR